MPSSDESRQAVIEKYRNAFKRTVGNQDLQRIDNWRLPNNSDTFSLQAVMDYIDVNGPALADLINGAEPKKSIPPE